MSHRILSDASRTAPVSRTLAAAPHSSTCVREALLALSTLSTGMKWMLLMFKSRASACAPHELTGSAAQLCVAVKRTQGETEASHTTRFMFECVASAT
jgi:hypothetical protein